MTLIQRFVLLGVTHLAEREECPAHSADVRRVCTERLEDLDGDVLGNLSEPDVIRALNRLEADGLLEPATVEDASPVGKGRPTYSLNVEVETVLDAFQDDERVAHFVDRIRTRHA